MYNFILLVLLSTTASAGVVFDEFPLNVEANEKYVFYSHGKIVEGSNSRPVNPNWGIYEFPKIKQALSDQEYNLIAYHRPKDTNPKEFAKKLASDVRLLIQKGVSEKHITLVGFSRGGAITILTSNLLAKKEVNFVILAGCGRYLNNDPDLTLYGHIYSMFETSDGVGSCQFLIDRSTNVNSFTELSISTGREHGAFYTPLPEWVVPVKKWIKSNHN